MADRDVRHVYTIPAGAPFADSLARELWNRAAQDPVRLSRGIVLVPHRRAARIVADAFLRLGDGQAMLLPEIRPVGDIDEDEPFGEGALALDAALGDRTPQPIPPLRRVLQLTRLVAQYLAGARESPTATADQAVRLAADLAHLLDQMQTEGVPFERLAGLAPAQYAEHWQQTLKFLRIVFEHWPAVLAGEGAIDPAVRRDRILTTLAGRWTNDPPDHPVTIAGSTGTVPATAALMRAIAGLPQGAVVLPGLDRALDDDGWRAVAGDPAHPQHVLARLLDYLELSRDDVRDWPGCRLEPALGGRMRLLSEAMRPAPTTDRWRSLPADAVQDAHLEGLAVVTCATLQDEAGVIALMLRETLESEGRTAALITADRALARRVKSELRRWAIEIDDSGGQPLCDTPQLAFWRLTGAAVADGLAPVPLLAALKHPLAASGGAIGFRRNVRLLERMLFRGGRPPPGIDGVLTALREAGAGAAAGAAERRQALADWLEPFAEAFRALEQALARSSVSLRALLLAHCRLVEQLAGDEGGDAPGTFWSGDTGGQAARFFAELSEASRDWPDINGGDYLPLLDALLAGLVFRPQYGTQSRLAILGPVDGRMQTFDRVILGGLNEGTWPPEPLVDPWLSRPMRTELGLPLPERRLGQSAHDFVQACGAPEVLITRSERVEGTPTIPARWLLRLNAVLDALGRKGALDHAAAKWLGWKDALDEASRQPPRQPPRPCPPVDARPRAFSVTQVATWQRNPYAIYARHILDLRPLDPLDSEPGAADRGNFIHAALDSYIRSALSGDRDMRLAALLEFGREAVGKGLDHPTVWAFWWPRFERIAAWFIEREDALAPTVRRSLTEITGTISLDTPGGPVGLRAKADRLDQHPDGGWSIIDYKTGRIPSRRELEAGWAPQLPLEALILRNGGFEGLSYETCVELAYWQLTGRDPAGRDVTFDNVDELVGVSERIFRDLVAKFDDPATPYLAVPDPVHAPAYDDYGHLARIREWLA